MLDLAQLTIISGGQTGVDRTALDFAIAHGIAHGGWCPRWREADDGLIHPRYNLTEHPSDGYSGRTRANVQDSDATLLIAKGRLTPGTKLTLKFIRQLQKKYFILNLDEKTNWPDLARCWLDKNSIKTLNIARGQ
jgi:hypothetical protein